MNRLNVYFELSNEINTLSLGWGLG